ncbi:MAG: SpoVR family protein, partial [Gammaproteobacteria bacterium]|nr:SpoVR family protein [Gammaproteobacteria bacterium]
LAKSFGLDFYPVEFEVVPPSFMTEVAVYGLPVRMPHWSFGVRYIHQLVQHKMGHSRIFEVVYPGDPGHAFLANNNSDMDNTLVCAHVLGHADFSKNNELFRRVHEQVGNRIVDMAAHHARRIEQAIERHGKEHVERVLDAALSLEQHIDVNQPLSRARYSETLEEGEESLLSTFVRRFTSLTGEDDEDQGEKAGEEEESLRVPIPPHPEQDLLWFIAQYAPEMEDWERDIFLAVREESFYFYPVFACQIMNEGWASYWHARLLREASFLPQDLYLDAMKTHSDVVRPTAGEKQIALNINPYHLGFSIWDRFIEAEGVDKARKVMQSEDDFSFVRNYLTAELADELNIFVYDANKNGEIKVTNNEIHQLHEAILGRKFNFGAPRVRVTELGVDGALELKHESDVDGRGLDTERAKKVIEYIHRVWRRPVTMRTLDPKGKETTLETGGKAAA